MAQDSLFFQATRDRARFLGVPFGLCSGAFLTGSEIAAHGFSRAVIVGLIGGALCSAALVVLIVSRWNKKWSATERREARRAYGGSRAISVPLGLVGVGVLGVVAALAGGHGQSLGVALETGAGVVFVVTVALATVIIVTRRGPLYS